MSKIIFKRNLNNPQDENTEATETAEQVNSAKSDKAEKSEKTEKQVKVAEVKEDTSEQVRQEKEPTATVSAQREEAVQMALFPGDEQKAAPTSVENETDKTETFNKEKIVKYFKRHPKKTVNTKVERFSPKLNKGLSAEQVETRFRQFLFNDTNKKFSRSYASIFIGNICTFFNLLCLLAFIALFL